MNRRNFITSGVIGFCTLLTSPATARVNKPCRRAKRLTIYGNSHVGHVVSADGGPLTWPYQLPRKWSINGGLLPSTKLTDKGFVQSYYVPYMNRMHGHHSYVATDAVIWCGYVAQVAFQLQPVMECGANFKRLVEDTRGEVPTLVILDFPPLINSMVDPEYWTEHTGVTSPVNLDQRHYDTWNHIRILTAYYMQQLGVPVFDIERQVDLTPDCYADGVHLNVKGNQLVADAIGSWLNDVL